MGNELCVLSHSVPGLVSSGCPGRKCQNGIMHTRDLLGKCLKHKEEEAGTGRKGDGERRIG